MTFEHVIFIPGVLLVGVTIGYRAGRPGGSSRGRARAQTNEGVTMLIFELSDEQKALVDTARRFTNERIIPVAAECDREAEFPMDVFEAALGDRPRQPDRPGRVRRRRASATSKTRSSPRSSPTAAPGIQTSMTANTLALTPIKLGRQRGAEEEVPRLAHERADRSRATRRPSRARGSDVAGHAARAFKKQSATTTCSTAQKCWITNANFARFYVIFATERPGRKRHKGIGAFIVHRDAPGLSVGKHEDKLGQRASDTAQVMLDDVHVPAGASARAAGATASSSRWRPSTRRAPTSARSAAGLMRRCLDECVAYAKERKTFGVADRQAPARAGHARRDGHPRRGDAPARTTRPPGTSTTASAIRSSRLAKAFGADSRDADGDRRRAGLRRQRLRQGVPRREADARRQRCCKYLRRHEPDSKAGDRAHAYEINALRAFISGSGLLPASSIGQRRAELVPPQTSCAGFRRILAYTRVSCRRIVISALCQRQSGDLRARPRRGLADLRFERLGVASLERLGRLRLRAPWRLLASLPRPRRFV